MSFLVTFYLKTKLVLFLPLFFFGSYSVAEALCCSIQRNQIIMNIQNLGGDFDSAHVSLDGRVVNNLSAAV